MENQIAKNWYMLLIKGIIMVVLALFVFINPEGTLKAVAFYLGIGFLISGILQFIRHVPGKSDESSWNRNKAEGIADLVIGLLLIVAPMVMVAIIPFIIGIWAAYYSILIIIDSFRGTGDGPMKLVSGIIILLLAYVLVFNPLLLGLTIIIWLGILLLVYGIFNIYMAIRLNKLRKIG
jgi:uncharacterized membrane protein HdeD (DUF308 family)